MNVFEALAEAQRRIGAVGKDATANAPGMKYNYRSIDSLLGAVHPIFSELGLVISPRVLEYQTEEFPFGKAGNLAHRVRLRIEYRVIASDGSYLPAELCPVVLAEGVDNSGKAHSYGLKVALGQLLSIPTEEDNEAQHWPEPEPVRHATGDYIAHTLANLDALDDDKQTKLIEWLGNFNGAPTATIDSLATVPAEIVERLAAAINRALEDQGAEPFGTGETPTDDKEADSETEAST